MDILQAIRLLDPETTAGAIAEIEYYNGFSGKKAALHAIDDACEIACNIMRYALPKELIKDRWGGYRCPRCENSLVGDENYCFDCGQCIKRGE